MAPDPSWSRAGDPSGPRQVPREAVEKGVRSPGDPLDAPALDAVRPGLSHEFGSVRIHRDEAAAVSARALGARAYAWGNHVVFGHGAYSPATVEGRDLLLHELGHVAQTAGAQPAPGTTAEVAPPGAPEERAADRLSAQMRTGASLSLRDATGTARPRVYRRIEPEDVASEMVGQQMTVSRAFAAVQNMGSMIGPPHSFSVTVGEVVRIVAWVNASTTATVALVAGRNAGFEFDIPKTHLLPAGASGGGLAQYGAGVAGQAAAVERGEAAIAAERARPGGPRAGEIPRLEGLQRNRQRLLNRRLIQGQMFNRFDPNIRRWVDHYTTQFPAFTPRLDPNLVKSMLFQESQMGTAGQHLEDPPSHPVKTRFNIGQVVDSSALALLTMMQEIDPTLITTHHLTNIRTDLSSAQAELRTLQRSSTRTPAQETRLAELVRLSGQSWEVFLWAYRETGQPTGFSEAVTAFFAAAGGGVPRNMDYDFWIRAAVRWLFEKRRTTSTWAEAIRAYNGSGARAEHYRDAVIRRASDARAGQAAGTEFVPAGI